MMGVALFLCFPPALVECISSRTFNNIIKTCWKKHVAWMQPLYEVIVVSCKVSFGSTSHNADAP